MATHANRAIHLLLVLGSLVLALAVFELVCRLGGWYAPPDPQPGRPDLYAYDADIGYRLLPGLDTTYHYPPDSPEAIPLVANSIGFRDDREPFDPDPRPRIQVLGDSFVFGHGVREEDRFPEVIEALEPAWRLDSMGMPGWGVDFMIRALERHGVRSEPDVVVLAVYTDDFRRVHPYFSGVGYRVPRFVLEDGQLVTVPYPEPRGWRGTRLFQALYQSVTTSRQVRDRFDLNGALLERFLGDAASHGFVPVVLFLPGRSDTSVDVRRRNFLAEWTAAHGVAYLDLTDAIHAAGVEETYIRNNWHWNADGHRIAAREIRAFLADIVPAR